MNDSPSRRRWWTQDEDRILLEEVKIQLELGGQQGAKNWSAIAEKLPGRSNKDCRKRWTKISLSSRKGTWTGAEDRLLRKAVGIFNFQWTKVAEMVGSRHPDQCAKRWRHSLDPNVNRSPWTEEEDHALVKAVQRFGRDWKQIGRELFPCRSTTDIKNRYVILSRRQEKSASVEPHVSAEPSPADPKCLNPMGVLGTNVGLSSVTSICQQNIFALAPDPFPAVPPADIALCPFDGQSSFLASNIPADSLALGGIIHSIREEPDWAAFDEQQLMSTGLLTPDVSVTYGREVEVYGYSTTSTSATPDVSESPATTVSTLVLEGLQLETLNLVIDTLLKTKSQFGMRLYNSRSLS
ncbi:hypothetical protein BJY04DRAFT_219297 [Aspergillus karnatakaensis]|uniref:uncharacterized protein n=1 Tax=Aspergillus karnatakaensis TaxID=1810916 RepID=UPI003CCCA5AF